MMEIKIRFSAFYFLFSALFLRKSLISMIIPDNSGLIFPWASRFQSQSGNICRADVWARSPSCRLASLIVAIRIAFTNASFGEFQRSFGELWRIVHPHPNSLTLSLTVAIPPGVTPCCTGNKTWRRGSESSLFQRDYRLKTPVFPMK